MRKLNLQEKEMVMKRFPRLGYLVIHKIEKLKLDYKNLEEEMDVAYDFILQDAE